jgi:excisionase family DNA binding protein
MHDAFNFDMLIDTLADRVAAKLRDKLAWQSATKPRLFTAEQAAVYLGRTKEAVEHMIAGGKLPVVRPDRRVFLDVQDLDRWIDANKA